MKLHPHAREPYVVFDGLATTPRLDHAECVVAAPDGTLWCGGEAGQIFRISGTDITEVASTGGFTLGLALDGDMLYVCDVLLPGIWRLDTVSGALTTFGTTVAGHDLLNPNYPVVLPDGSLLVSDSGRAHAPHTGLVRFDADGKGSVWLDEPFAFANGLALSQNGHTLYIAESWAHRIRAIDLDGHSRPLGPVRTHAHTPGYVVDGLALAPNGVLYVGAYEPSAILRIPGPDQVELYAHDETAHILCHPTNLAFRGDELVVANLGRWHLTGFDTSLVPN